MIMQAEEDGKSESQSVTDWTGVQNLLHHESEQTSIWFFIAKITAKFQPNSVRTGGKWGGMQVEYG
jgi:hypothetical protein